MNSSPQSKNKARILVLAGVYPCATNPDEAANLIAHELTCYLASVGDFEIAFSVVQALPKEPSPDAVSDLNRLQAMGVRILKPIVLKERVSVNLVTRVIRLIHGDPRLIQGYDCVEAVSAQLVDFPADIILTVWSEVATAASARVPVHKIAYYGNPDHKVLAARRRLTPKSGLRAFLPIDEVVVSGIERAHLKVMSMQDAIGDVAKNDADYYRSKGLKQAFYVPNMWLPPTASFDEIRNGKEATTPLKIIGNVGNLGATGNTFGLATLGKDIVPVLKRELGMGNFEIHLFGGGNPDPSVAKLLTDPCIVKRGFVHDIEAEMRHAPIFLVANNSTEFVVGHTRFLHAWSQGCCVVAFKESRLAMPEIEHDRNALLGTSPEEVVQHIVQCSKDQNLRRRIGRQGFEDLRTRFAPEIAGEIMAGNIRKLLSARTMSSKHASLAQ